MASKGLITKTYQDMTKKIESSTPETPQQSLLAIHGVSHSALLEVVKALRNDEPNFKFKPCSNCKGKGYTHGYGEYGVDADWCNSCGGMGEEVDEDATNQMKLQLVIEVLSKHCG